MDGAIFHMAYLWMPDPGVPEYRIAHRAFMQPDEDGEGPPVGCSASTWTGLEDAHDEFLRVQMDPPTTMAHDMDPDEIPEHASLHYPGTEHDAADAA